MPKALILALALLADSASAEAKSLRIIENGQPDCPSFSQIESSLKRRLGASQVTRSGGTTADQERWLRVEPSSQGVLRIELGEGPRSMTERLLSVGSGECSEQADTIALVVENWLRDLPWLQTVPPAEADSAKAPPIPSTKSAPPPLSPSAKTALPPVVKPSLPPPEKSAPKPGSTTSPRHFAHLSVLLAGGASLSLQEKPSLTAMGNLSLEVGLGSRFGLGVRGTVESETTITHSPGSFTIRRSPLVLYGRVAFHVGRKQEIGVRVGPLLDIVAARSSGFTLNHSDVLFDPGLWLGLSWEWTAYRGLFLFVETSLDVLFRTDAFAIANLGTVATTPSAWLNGSGGLGWRFF